MVNNKDDLKKKIIYRSMYRGNKEMDFLLSNFTKNIINKLNNDDLIKLSELLEIDDDNLYKFHQGLNMNIQIEKNKVTDLFKKFILKKN